MAANLAAVRLWRLSDPSDFRYARAIRRGSWTESRGICPSCTASSQVRVPPLLIEWESGCDEIGDFTWPGFDSEVVVTQAVLDELRIVLGFEPGPVEAEAPKRGGGRVRAADRDVDLHELWVTAVVDLDRDRSTAELEHTCPTCGTERWQLYGVERWDSHFDHELKELVRTKTERRRKAGVFLDGPRLEDIGVFRVRQFPAWIFCTDKVRSLVEEKGFTNVSFLEMGEAT